MVFGLFINHATVKLWKHLSKTDREKNKCNYVHLEIGTARQIVTSSSRALMQRQRKPMYLKTNQPNMLRRPGDILGYFIIFWTCELIPAARIPAGAGETSFKFIELQG